MDLRRTALTLGMVGGVLGVLAELGLVLQQVIAWLFPIELEPLTGLTTEQFVSEMEERERLLRSFFFVIRWGAVLWLINLSIILASAIGIAGAMSAKRLPMVAEVLQLIGGVFALLLGLVGLVELISSIELFNLQDALFLILLLAGLLLIIEAIRSFRGRRRARPETIG